MFDLCQPSSFFQPELEPPSYIRRSPHTFTFEAYNVYLVYLFHRPRLPVHGSVRQLLLGGRTRGGLARVEAGEAGDLVSL